MILKDSKVTEENHTEFEILDAFAEASCMCLKYLMMHNFSPDEIILELSLTKIQLKFQSDSHLTNLIKAGIHVKYIFQDDDTSPVQYAQGDLLEIQLTSLSIVVYPTIMHIIAEVLTSLEDTQTQSQNQSSRTHQASFQSRTVFVDASSVSVEIVSPGSGSLLLSGHSVTIYLDFDPGKRNLLKTILCIAFSSNANKEDFV